MSTATNLTDLYIEQLMDLWSANDQMATVVDEMADRMDDQKLATKLRSSSKGIRQHSDLLRNLLEDCGSRVEKEPCKGMEGLVREAKKHALEADMDDASREVATIAQYQRMCHYGIAGFGTAKAYAEALGKKQHAVDLDDALERIYESDDYMSELAERSKNIEIRSN